MVKLIRLATNNDGVFKSSFGNSIDIKENAKVALLNLTFETAFDQLVVTANNSSITFQSDGATAFTTVQANLPLGTYTSATLDKLYEDIEWTLNRCLDYTIARETNAIFSAFRITKNLTTGNKQIEYRYAPLTSALSIGGWNGDGPEQMMLSGGLLDINETGTIGTDETIICTMTTGQPARANTSNWIAAMPGKRLNNGSAIFMARCYDIRDNASGLEDNGFAIGLSATPLAIKLTGGVDIPLGDRKYEIRVNRMGEVYKFIRNGVAEAASTIQPLNIDLSLEADELLHDVISFELTGGTLSACVFQDLPGPPRVGVRHVLFTMDIEQGEQLYPYIYINGAITECQINMVNFSVDPWIGGDGNPNWEHTGGSDGAYLADDLGLQNGFEDMLAVPIGQVMPQPSRTKWGDDYTGPLQTSLTMNADIWKVLGYTKNGKGDGPVTDTDVRIGDNIQGDYWSWWKSQIIPAIRGSDNFMVISDTLALDSYDASAVHYTATGPDVVLSNETDKMGRRKNILMTIPVNDNTQNLVEFQTNTPIFIDINNVDTINTRNLNFRILKKDFSPITQSTEMAIMTILIED